MFDERSEASVGNFVDKIYGSINGSIDDKLIFKS